MPRKREKKVRRVPGWRRRKGVGGLGRVGGGALEEKGQGESIKLDILASSAPAGS